MSDTMRIDELVHRLENEESPADMRLNPDEMRLLDVLALLRSTKHLQADPVFAAGLREQIASEIGLLSEDKSASRKGGRRGLIVVAIATIALAGAGAIYFERSGFSPAPATTKKAVPDTPRPTAFGKLPLFAGQTAWNNPAEQANGQLTPTGSKGANATSTAIAPGSPSAMWKYVWNAGEPKLPSTVRVFKNKPNALNKDAAYALAKKLGFEGPARSITVSYPGTPNEDASYAFITSDGARTLTLSSGTFEYSASAQKTSTPANMQPVADDKAISLATAWLESAGLLPENASKGKIGGYPGALGMSSAQSPLISAGGSATGSTGTAKEATTAPAPSVDNLVSPSKFVSFSLPVSSPGNGVSGSMSCESAVVIEIGSDGNVASAHGVIFRNFASSEYPVNPSRGIFDKIAVNQGGASTAPQGTAGAPTGAKATYNPIFTVHSVELGYTQIAAANGSVYLEPIYLFKGSLDPIYGHLQDVTITAPAVKDEFVEQAAAGQVNSTAIAQPSNATGGITGR